MRTLALYAAVTAVVFAPFFTRGATLMNSSRLDCRRAAPSPAGNLDAATAHLAPITTFSRELHHGRFALWEPGHLCGAPMLVDVNFHPFYPPLIAAYALFDAPTGYMILIVLHFGFAGFAFHLFARKQGCSFLACFGSSLVWLLCNFSSAWMPLNGGFTGVWLPLTLVAILSLRRNSWLGPLAAAGLCGGLLVLSGIAQFALYGTLLAAVWLIVRARREGFSTSGALALASIFAAITMMLSAPEWILRFEVMEQSGRAKLITAEGPEAAVFGEVLEDPLTSHAVLAKGLRFYLGALPIVLALARPLRLWRDRRSRPLLGVAAAGILLGLGYYASVQAGWKTPLYTLLSPRWMLFYALAGAGVASLVIDHLREELPGRRAALLGAGVAAAALCVWASAVAVERAPDPPSTFRAQQLKTAGAAMIFSGAALGALFAWRKGKMIPLIAVGLLAVDLCLHRDAVVPFARPPKEITPHPLLGRARDEIRESGEPWRAAGFTVRGTSKEGNVFSAFGLESPDGWNSLCSADYYLFALLAGAEVSVSRSVRLDPATLESPKAKLFNLRYWLWPAERVIKLPGRFITLQDGIALYRIQNTLPRLFAPAAVATAPRDKIIARMRLPDFDPEREALILSPTEEPLPQGSARIKITAYQADSLEAQVEAEGDVTLLISIPHDPGWQARLEGSPVALEKADLAFMAVRIPKGNHVLSLSYRPRMLTVAVALSAAGILYLGLLLRLKAARSPR